MHKSICHAIQEALRVGGAVVALESTLVAQGLPWPENLETARAAEQAVRATGAVPATVAIMGGLIHVGLTAKQLECLARSGSFRKVGRRDLASAVARGEDAATTVSATLWIARQVGITVMATGGLGGVHREAGSSFDVSTDLDELARADGCLIVCSGVKTILDIPATLEALETRGVPVVGYRTSTLPGFTSVCSGRPLETRVETPEEAARLVRVHRELNLPAAIVLAQPVPETEAVDPAAMDAALATALEQASIRKITGKPLTPFLLDAVRVATEGRSLRANTALIRNNAALAGAVASALCDAGRESG